MSKLITDKSLKNCAKCKYAIMKDWGYSNYTVEGTSFHCANELHPADGFDRFYGEDSRLQFAEECKSFKEGDYISIDCDSEEHPYTDDPELLMLLFNIEILSELDIRLALEKGWFEGCTDTRVAELILKLY